MLRPAYDCRADEIFREEFLEGGRLLIKKLGIYKPRMLTVLGMGAYRTAFNRPKARIGPQDETIGGTSVWLLPNPSGLNANYQLGELTRLFRELKDAAG